IQLNHDIFLENTKYNALFAGPARLSLASESFRLEAAKFANNYLQGDKGVLSHALWYIRKRYCDKVPLCWECPVAGYCAYFRITGGSPRPPSKISRDRERTVAKQSILSSFSW